MKKLMCMAIIAMVLTVFNACQKDDAIKKTELPSYVSSKYEPEFGKYTKEMIVYDSSGENSLFIALHADKDEYIQQYLRNFKLELVSGPNWQDLMLKSGNLPEKNRFTNTSEIPKLALEQKVTVEFLAYNLKDNTNYGLSVVKILPENGNKLKSGDFIYGQYNDFVTTESFIGVVHKGYGWDGNNYDLMTFFSKKDCWLCGWDFLGSRLLIGDHPYEYYEYVEDYSGDAYKLAVGVYFDARETDGSCLFVTDIKNNFRGQQCSIGSYDFANCFVGTPPPGTTAFISGGQFYYTPINGNQCPLPGSEFDGANCWVMTIPTNAEPFIWSNNWYVKTDRILN